MCAAYNDGNVPYGSQAVTIGGVAFIAENINPDVPSDIIERRGALGQPTGQVIIEGFTTGSATLQLATTVTVPPTIGATFTITRNGGATYNCAVSQVGDPEAQLDAKKVNINFRRLYN